MKKKIALGIGMSFVTVGLITFSPPVHATEVSQIQIKTIPEKSGTATKGVEVNSTLKKINKNKSISTQKTKKITPELSINTKTVKQKGAHTASKKIKTTNEKKQLGTPTGEMKKNGARRAPPITTPQK